MIKKSSREYKAGYNAGIMLVAATRKCPDPMFKIAMTNEFDRSKDIQKLMCKTAEAVLEAGEEEESAAYNLVKALEEADNPVTRYALRKYIYPIMDALNSESNDLEGILDAEKVEKSASVLSRMAETAGSVIGSGKNIADSLLWLGGLTGASLGGLAWYVNRAAKETDAEAEAKDEQARHYRRIAKDLKRRMAVEARDKVNDAVERAAYETSPNSYVI